ncbi:DUF6401 family natural product biosynthesis protein [Nocardia amikacinitolerans]|uniref:DUF6401 family natural product biosynthesis protein n=1 Tax=Nocardia amikacinitolerans TaxID=756689 RepID=UPI0020A346B7|nr:DUF6401 family natural product biosynthesis protein [Nocardia amikacinitolerans]
MFLLGPALLEVSARRMLNRLHTTHGVPARTAAAEFPAVSAALDQHAAAVRDILDFGIDGASSVPVEVLLAGYVRGLLDHVGEPDAAPMTSEAPADAPGWVHADWLQMRLAGVCQYAGNQPA